MVSVIVTTYNHKEYINLCLESILKQQTNFPFEIILGEDESNDGTRDICIDYANRYPDKIRLNLRSRKDVVYINGSATGRYNFIQNLKVCQGKYIAICEGDDYWIDPLKLQKQVDFLESHKEYAIHSGYAKLSNDKDKLIGRVSDKGYFERSDFFTQNNIVTCTVMFRNPFFKEFPDSFYKVRFGDWFLYAMLLNETKSKVYTSDEVLSFYRVHSGGAMLSLNKINHFKAHMEQIKYLKKYLKCNFRNKNDVKNINNYMTQIFEGELANKNYVQVIKSIFLNFKHVGFKSPLTKYLNTIGKRVLIKIKNSFKVKSQPTNN